MPMKVKTLPELLQSGAITFNGDITAFVSILQMLENFPFWFNNIVTPSVKVVLKYRTCPLR
jgi:alkyl sulfatase BDS1-like metallo-beta-lactamase superfamily hydrolase